jgi:hypothetical protein
MLRVRCGWRVAYPVSSLLTNFPNNFLHQGTWIFLFIIVSSIGVAGTWYTLQKSCIVFPVTHQAVYKYSYSCTGDLPLPLVPGNFVWTHRILPLCLSSYNGTTEISLLHHSPFCCSTCQFNQYNMACILVQSEWLLQSFSCSHGENICAMGVTG